MDLISSYIDPPEDMPPHTDFTVNLAPFPTHFLPSGRAVFPLSKRKDAIRMARRDVRPDTVIFATGYKQEFGLFDPEGAYPSPGEADVRNIVRTGDESVSFIGFVRPGVGMSLEKSLTGFMSTNVIWCGQAQSHQSPKCRHSFGYRY